MFAAYIVHIQLKAATTISSFSFNDVAVFDWYTKWVIIVTDFFPFFLY